MYLYLDESGDLGFDFINKKPSRFFVITLLAISDASLIKSINKAVSKTLANKINHPKKKSRIVTELKGNDTRLPIKEYFFNNMPNSSSSWGIYSIVLDKLELLKHIRQPGKDRVYNQMAHQLLEKINFSNICKVNLIIDRSKDNQGIKEFNDYLYNNLSLKLNLQTRLYITHDHSEKHQGIQAADMFCYGIARKYEKNDCSWYDYYKDKILVECKFHI